MSIQVANKEKGRLSVKFLNVIHGRQETIVNQVSIGVAVKTKCIEIIRFTADSDDLEFVTGTYIFLFDCDRNNIFSKDVYRQQIDLEKHNKMRGKANI